MKVDKIFDVVYKKLHQDCDKFELSMIYLCNRHLNMAEHKILVELFSEKFPTWAARLSDSYWGK